MLGTTSEIGFASPQGMEISDLTRLLVGVILQHSCSCKRGKNFLVISFKKFVSPTSHDVEHGYLTGFKFAVL